MSEKNLVDTFLEKLAGVTVPAKVEEVVPPTTIEKTAEEIQFEKFANQDETIQCATTLNLCAGYIEKIASLKDTHPEMKDLLSECAGTLSGCSGDFMVGLQKLANNEPGQMVIDMIDTQDGLYKVASVLNSLAEGCEDTEFVKVASAVNDVNNKLFTELEELSKSDSSVADYITQRFASAE